MAYPKINFHRIFVIAGLTTLVIVYAVLWLRMISSPAERTGADFIVFFTAGRIAQTDGAEHVFEPLLQQAIQQAEVGFPLVPGQVLLYNHVPYLIPILKILISGNYVASFYRWAALLLALYIAGVVLLSGVLQRAGWRRLEVWLAAAGMLTFFPLFVSLLNGQDTAFTLFGLCLYLAGFLTGRDWLAGLGLALTSVRPQVTVLLAVPFLFRRQKVFGWFCLAGGILGILSLAAVGLGGMRGFLNLLLVSAGGDWYGLKEPLMVNLVGLLWRVAPGLGATIHPLDWLGGLRGHIDRFMFFMGAQPGDHRKTNRAGDRAGCFCRSAPALSRPDLAAGSSSGCAAGAGARQVPGCAQGCPGTVGALTGFTFQQFCPDLKVKLPLPDHATAGVGLVFSWCDLSWQEKCL